MSGHSCCRRSIAHGHYTQRDTHVPPSNYLSTSSYLLPRCCGRQLAVTEQQGSLSEIPEVPPLIAYSQGSINFFPVDHMICWIFVLVQKDSNAKKESFCCTEPSRLFTKFTTQNRKSKNEHQSFFVATILCFPEIALEVLGHGRLA